MTITEYKNQMKQLGVTTASKLDDSVRGFSTVSVEEIKAGDAVILNNRGVTITEDNETQAQPNILVLDGRGCNFCHDDEIRKTSDVGNYRVCTMDENIKGKNGKTYFLEFTRADARTVRTTNKRTGQPLKKPIVEIVLKNALYVRTQFSRIENGWTLAFADLETEKRYNATEAARPYTKRNILDVVNEISADHFDDVAILYWPDMLRVAGDREKFALDNGTPRAYKNGGRVLVRFEYGANIEYQYANGATWDVERRAWVA